MATQRVPLVVMLTMLAPVAAVNPGKRPMPPPPNPEDEFAWFSVYGTGSGVYRRLYGTDGALAAAAGEGVVRGFLTRQEAIAFSHDGPEACRVAATGESSVNELKGIRYRRR